MTSAAEAVLVMKCPDDNQFQIVERFADRREFGVGLQRILTIMYAARTSPCAARCGNSLMR